MIALLSRRPSLCLIATVPAMLLAQVPAPRDVVLNHVSVIDMAGRPLQRELRDAANRVVDPFRNGLWAAPPIYNTPITLMDLVIAASAMTLQQIKDPVPNVQSIPRGSVLGVGVSMAGGGAGDVIRLVITAPTGATFSDNPLTFTTTYRHSFWFWSSQLSPTPGVWTVSIFVNGVLVQSETVIAP